MALQITEMPRRFVMDTNGNKADLPDPDPSMPADKVRSHYAATHPALATAALAGPVIEVVDGKESQVFTFSGRAGTKG
jgi:PRTRC genetic system protein C